MADHLLNGAAEAAQNIDVEMKEDAPAEQLSLNGTPPSLPPQSEEAAHNLQPLTETSQPISSTIPPPTAAPTIPAPAAAPTPPAARPSSIPPPSFAPPEKPNAHGSPTRVYINQNITPHLLEGMKYLAAYEPEKPLKWLSEFLAKKSAEIEGA